MTTARHIHYAHTTARYLPIGSRAVETACKTLAYERLKRSEMHWRHAGGWAILTLRALVRSERFDRPRRCCRARTGGQSTPPKSWWPFSINGPRDVSP